MSTPNLTPVQRAILAALSRTKEQSNAQVAEAASRILGAEGSPSEQWTSKVLRFKLAAAGLAASRVVQDADDPQTSYRLWRRL